MTLRGLIRIRGGVDDPSALRGAPGPRPASGPSPAGADRRRWSRCPASCCAVPPPGRCPTARSSAEAPHQTLAIAMEKPPGRPVQHRERAARTRAASPLTRTATCRRSAIKQVASGRFGVTSEYLVNASDLQIKMAQGAKPGEGGQLPGHKVYPWIARTRVFLDARRRPGSRRRRIHDIYSIRGSRPAHPRPEGQRQPDGAGTTSSWWPRSGSAPRRRRRVQGARRRRADLRARRWHRRRAADQHPARRRCAHGSSGWPRPSRRCCATACGTGSWFRSTGSSSTGRDVIIAALLGAEEFGFATAPLVVAGCVLMRVCHLDTCPVGGDPEPGAARRFTGGPRVRGDVL